MSGFNKIVPEIVQSSIWNEPSDIRVVWITLIAVKDENGYVRGDERTIARIANVPLESATAALERFQQPDPNSNTPDNDGRRIERHNGGWIVLNHDLYRTGDRKEYMRNYMRERRRLTDVNNVNVNTCLPSVSASASASVNTHTEEVPKRDRFAIPTPEEVAAYACEIGYPMDGAAWCDSYAQKGWMVGKAKMKDWKAAVRNWKRNGWMPNGAAKPAAYDDLPDMRPEGAIL